MERFLSVREIPVRGRKVFLRVDLNAPVRGGVITDDTRIREALPTLVDLLDRGAAVVVCSHMGRPKGQVVPALSMAPVAERLRHLMPGRTLALATDVIGPDARSRAAALKPGEALLLENVRFEPGETKGDEALAAALFSLAPDHYVNDAFGAAHRPHASVFALPKRYGQVSMGGLLERELAYLLGKLGEPERPYLAILGGAKVSDKIPILESLIEKVDELCIGGAMAYTFLVARGSDPGSSLVERDQVETARAILSRAAERGVTVHLPVDHVVSTALEDEAGARPVAGRDIPLGLAGFDIGPETARAFGAAVARARTVLWNGPMGVFERPAFAAGTLSVAHALAASGALSVVGGGDSVAAIHAAGVADQVSHISTGGGASLELLAGEDLPGIQVLTRV